MIDGIKISSGSYGWFITKDKDKGYFKVQFLLKDFTWCDSQGWIACDAGKDSFALGYYPTETIAQAYLDEYLSRNQIKGEQKMNKTMMKLSNGVEISEDTVVSALKKAGISVEPAKPRRIFEAGDVAEAGEYKDAKRIILYIDEKIRSFDLNGFCQSISQVQFEACDYKYIGKLTDFIN